MKSIYYKQPHQELLVKKVKATINKESAVLFNPASSKIEKVRAVYRMAKLVPVINDELPEPTVKNTRQEISHTLIGIRDRFLPRLMMPSRFIFLKAIINLAIIIVDTDFYRPFVLWWLLEVKKASWPELGPHQPDPHFFKDD